jgi:SAM-dependent methyltransferase
VTRGVERWMARLYDRRRGWIDGTTRFAALVRRRLRPDMRILDLGAGPGKPGRVNFRGEVASVVGVDPDRLLRLNEQVDTRVLAVAEALPFRSASFDLILADWVVEHLPDPNGTASEIQRVLKPGGRFVFRTGNVWHYSYAISALTPHWFHRLVANRVRGLAPESVDPYPTRYRMNTRRDARRVLTRAGLREEELVTVEAEPSYLVFSTPSFLLGVAYERLVNRTPSLAGLRACLFGCFRKDAAAPGAPRLATATTQENSRDLRAVAPAGFERVRDSNA